jgi:hypothetical protein
VRAVRRLGHGFATISTHIRFGMNAMSLCYRHRRSGLSMTEMVVTVAITTVAMVGGVQIMSAANRQCQAVECRRLAGLEAGNVMEQIMARPWAQLAPGQAAVCELSHACRELLPDAKLRLQVAAEATDPAVRRITVEIDWQATPIHRSDPVRLVAWRYLTQEAKP